MGRPLGGRVFVRRGGCGESGCDWRGPSTRVRVLCRAMTDARLSFCDVQPGVWLASIEGCLEAVRSRPVLRLTAEDGLHNAGF